MFRPTQITVIALTLSVSTCCAFAADDVSVETNQPVSIEQVEPPASQKTNEPTPATEADQPVTPPSLILRDPEPRDVPETESQPASQAQPDPPAPQESLPLGSADPDSGSPDTSSASNSSSSWMWQTFGALAIVIALIFFLRFMLQRLGGQASTAAHVAPLVEVLARSSIAPKTQLMFLKINQRVVVVAQSQAGLQTVTTFDNPEDTAWVLRQVESARPMSISQGFKQLMHRFDNDYAAQSAEEGADDSEQYVDRTRNEMSSLLSRIRNLSQKGQ